MSEKKTVSLTLEKWRIRSWKVVEGVAINFTDYDISKYQPEAVDEDEDKRKCVKKFFTCEGKWDRVVGIFLDKGKIANVSLPPNTLCEITTDSKKPPTVYKRPDE